MSVTSRLGALRRLSPVEWRVLCQALVLLAFATVGLRVAGLKRMQALLAGQVRARGCAAAGDARVVARMVSIAQRYGPGGSGCLAAALTLQSLLRHRGLDAQLRLGVRKVEGRLEAHAWIEHDGTPLMEPAGVHGRFSAFDGAIVAARE